jgi:hypothetical protein
MTTTPPTRIGKTTVAACVGLSLAQVQLHGVDPGTQLGERGVGVDGHHPVILALRWEA